jgi:hypothetical protein
VACEKQAGGELYLRILWSVVVTHMPGCRSRIDLAEFKRRYEATFANASSPRGDGMRFRFTASVRLK